jgi:uncharacterized protein
MRTEFFTSRFLRSALCCAVFFSSATPRMADAQSATEPAATAASPATKADTGPATGYKEIKWDVLVPKDWNPAKRFKSMNLGVLDDRDPRVMQAMRELRETYDNAPTVSQLDGMQIKLPGYVVPLEEVKGEVSEFLLVPYFGACIHTPPPPANQIIHVTVTKPLKGLRSMDTVWVSGVLKTARQDSSMGTSGYRITTVVLERYVAGERR